MTVSKIAVAEQLSMTPPPRKPQGEPLSSSKSLEQPLLGYPHGVVSQSLMQACTLVEPKNLQVAPGEVAATWVTGFSNEVQFASNRAKYYFRNIPPKFQSMFYLFGDIYKTSGTTSFDVNVPVTVYIAQHPGHGMLPDGFVPTGEQIPWDQGEGNSYIQYEVHQRTYPAGSISYAFGDTTQCGIFVGGQARAKLISPKSPPSAAESAQSCEAVPKDVIPESSSVIARVKKAGVVCFGLLLLGSAWAFLSPNAGDGAINARTNHVDVETHRHFVPVLGGRNSSNHMQNATVDQAQDVVTSPAPHATPAQSRDISNRLRGQSTSTGPEQPPKHSVQIDHTRTASAGNNHQSTRQASAPTALQKWEASGKSKVCAADVLRCDEGGCNQRGCVQPTCDGGMCKQTDAFKPACGGGHCDQSGATMPSCSGGDC